MLAYPSLPVGAQGSNLGGVRKRRLRVPPLPPSLQEMILASHSSQGRRHQKSHSSMHLSAEPRWLQPPASPWVIGRAAGAAPSLPAWVPSYRAELGPETSKATLSPCHFFFCPAGGVLSWVPTECSTPPPPLEWSPLDLAPPPGMVI